MNNLTQILNQVEAGDAAAAAKLLPLVYDELRRVATRKMSEEKAGNTLQPTALVHEAWMRLSASGAADQTWNSRGHFYSAAAEAMRRILIESARKKASLRKGGEFKRVELQFHPTGSSLEHDLAGLLSLDEALRKLKDVDFDCYRLVLVASALVLVSLIAGTAVSTWQAIRATESQKETEQLRREAVEFAHRLKDANILLVSARANADQGRIPQAYTEYTRATELSPDHYLTWAGRGSLLANLGAWKLAARDYAKAIQLGTPPDDPSWWGVPQLCFYAGEKDAYDSVCKSPLSESRDDFFKF